MAGRKHLLISAFALTVVTAFVFAEEAQNSPAPGTSKPVIKRGEKKKGPNSPEFENVLRAIDALTPEQRRRFQDNFARWINLPTEEKRVLRDRDQLRRKRMRQEIDRAIRDTGLQLTPEQRTLFTKRYAEERRKVEEQLRREMQEKRQPRVRGIVEKLKEEFSKPEPATPTASPAVSAP